jgi:ATP-binding cassette subfamily B multidrug efflux pump
VKIKATISRINSFLAENIQGMKLVQMFNRQIQKLKELKALDREYYRYNLIEVVLNSLGRPLVDIINNITIAVVIWFGISQITGNVLQIGVLFAFITYIRQIFDPIGNIAETYTAIQSAVVSSERIFEMLDNTEDLEDLDHGAVPDDMRGEIEFRDVWFAYNDENWVLKNVSFRIKPGEMTAFVGATGSGKSTIISLISGFYRIQKGAILIDGMNINDYNLSELRKRISVVLQDVFLFTGDIKSNIRLKNESITDEEIMETASLISADNFISQLPGGYDEPVMERGCTLSAGQRQLIAFARAMVKKPPIMVLDEATANIDTETEMAIQKVIANKSGATTMIVIAHRLSTIRSADRIFVVDAGIIAESGNHDELLARGGIYARLYESHELIGET